MRYLDFGRMTAAVLCAWAIAAWISVVSAQSGEVRVAEEPIWLPTYDLGPPERNPIFYSNESYQGAQKRVYPYALQDHLTHVRTNRSYTALRLENDFVRIVVLPEIGGHLFEGTDKSNGYPFFYRQHVIKPALIGMLGAWISGGIEWCAFHHHRNTTFLPVDYTLAENEDGSKTIWIGEIERRHRMKWLIGLTLHPDRSYLEATGKFFNRTALPHSILYWANVAVHANEEYQILFPPSVQVATYHSKIDFSSWPVSRGRYRGVDYRGVDLSWWKNHPKPISFFAWNLAENFMGGYDHGREAGVVHVANHHIVCGAKLWEWSPGPEGRAWDKILTDEDGPYAELMVGAFSDNQPDYSWIKPGEVKTFQQFWYPVREIGGFKNANLDAAVNLELGDDHRARFGFHTTAVWPDAKAILTARGQTLFEDTIRVGPAAPYQNGVSVPAGTREMDLRVELSAPDGRRLITYQPIERKPIEELPAPVAAPPPPEEIPTVEEVYLTGHRIEQIHNPSVDPTRYYREALRRDPGDSRANTALGLHHLKRGDYAGAETHFRAAIDRLSLGYTRPQNAEPHYYLGCALVAQGRRAEAEEHLYRATWDQAMHHAAFCELAGMALREGDFLEAFERIEQALTTGTLNTKALGLKTLVLRKLNRAADARRAARQSLAIDPLDLLALNELGLVQQILDKPGAVRKTQAALEPRLQRDVQSALELAADYCGWGQWSDARDVLERLARLEDEDRPGLPLVYYYLGYVHDQLGEPARAEADYARASALPAAFCFPFRLETAGVLEAALRHSPRDARAYYYLGNLWYERQPDEAIRCWEQSRALDPSLATVHRNLGWAYYRTRNNITNAIACYERAVERDSSDPRLFLELDQLYEFGNAPPEVRLARLEQNHDVVRRRVESLEREIALLVLNAQYDRAIDCLATNFFHVREGGGEIHDVYVDAHLLKGIHYLKNREPDAARRQFFLAAEYPENLSVGRPENDRRAAQVGYYLATAQAAAGQETEAQATWRRVLEQEATARWPDARFYQALCRRALGQETAAVAVFDRLVDQGKSELARPEAGDFFAKFGEQDTRQTRAASAHYTVGLGLLGRGDLANARAAFAEAVRLNRSHLWATHHRDELATKLPE